MATMDDTTQAQTRWFHLTPGRFVLALLAVEVLLWLSDRFCWLAWHKGYAVLTGVAVVGVAMLGMFLWFGVALVFRWRFQFSIRSLLVLVVAVALPCSWLGVEMKNAREQKDAVEAFMKPGLRFVEYDCQVDEDDETLSGIHRPAPLWLINLLGWEFFSNPFSAHVLNSMGNDADLEHIKRITSLHSIYLDGAQVADAGLDNLNTLSHLQFLALDGTPVTDAGLQRLKGLSTLRRLILNFTPVTDAGLDCLKGLTELRELSLNCEAITDAGLDSLTGLTQLRYLSVRYSRVTDVGVEKLHRALPQCKIVR